MSEESKALWDAYRELGRVEDHEASQDQCEGPEKAINNKQLHFREKENTLKLLREESEDEEEKLEQRTLKVCYR